MELTDLIDSIDIVDFISQYVDLNEKNGEFWGLSPFKEERTPSFSVRKETNSFYDFSSGIGGNVLTFVRYYDHCGYADAIEKLRQYAGVDHDVVQRKRLVALDVAKRFSPPRKIAKQNKSVILPDDYMERYEQDPDKLSVWESEGISRASLDKFDVRYDSFSNRLVYPIRSQDGKIVNIGGRTLDPEWKKKELRKYTYFYGWGELKVLYGFFENLSSIREKHEIILFEGCKSVLLADTYGIHNTAALLTSHLNPHQMKLLVSLGARVVFALDKDVCIRNDHNIQKLKQYVNVEYLYDSAGLLGEKDSPVDRGPEVFKKLYEGRLRWK